MQKTLFAVFGLVSIGIIGRLLPHLPNATPITAITVTGSRYVGRAWAVMIPLIAMLVSDAVIGFYDWKILAGVYIAFAAIGFFAHTMRRRTGMISSTLFIASSSVFFFLITNFTVWMFSPWYEKSIGGLLYAYELGLPFLRNMFVGDLAFTFGLLGVLYIVQVMSRTKLRLIQAT